MDLNDFHNNCGASNNTSRTAIYMASKDHLPITAETPSYPTSTNRNFILMDFLGVGSSNLPLRPLPPTFRPSFIAPTNFLTLDSGGTDAQVHRIPPNLRPSIAPVVPPSPACDHPTGDFPSSSRTNKRCRRFDGTRAEYRHQRKMRNRGSAERSRIRRNAYDIELKVKIALLKEEYVELKRKEEELRLALQEARPFKRSLSAPFFVLPQQKEENNGSPCGGKCFCKRLYASV